MTLVQLAKMQIQIDLCLRIPPCVNATALIFLLKLDKYSSLAEKNKGYEI